MLKFRVSISLMALIFTAALGAQESKTPAAPGWDAQGCMKHCQEMAAAHQKMMDSHKAAMAAHEAAWKDIQAQLDATRKARGEKKVEALEAVVEKLVAFHQSMQTEMGASAMMASDKMGCCGEAVMGTEMGMGMGMGMDCPMMKNKAGNSEDTAKPAK